MSHKYRILKRHRKKHRRLKRKHGHHAAGGGGGGGAGAAQGAGGGGDEGAAPGGGEGGPQAGGAPGGGGQGGQPGGGAGKGAGGPGAGAPGGAGDGNDPATPNGAKATNPLEKMLDDLLKIFGLSGDQRDKIKAARDALGQNPDGKSEPGKAPGQTPGQPPGAPDIMGMLGKALHVDPANVMGEIGRLTQGAGASANGAAPPVIPGMPMMITRSPDASPGPGANTGGPALATTPAGPPILGM